MRRSYYLFFLLVLLMFFTAGCAKKSSPPPSDTSKQETPKSQEKVGTEAGAVAPGFILPDLTGKQINLSDYRGKTVFLNFWSLECGYCVEELPQLQKFYAKYGKQVVLLTINLNDDPQDIADFFEQNGYTFPVLLDTSGSAANSYLVRYIPANFVIGPDGKILVSKIGGMKFEEMEKELK